VLFTLAVGCAAGETDDFFKVEELPGDTATKGDASNESNGSSGGSANIEVGVVGSNSGATNTTNPGETSSSTSTTGVTEGSGGSGGTTDVATAVGGTDSGGNAGTGAVGGQGTGGDGGSVGGTGGNGATGGSGGAGGSGGTSGTGGTGGQEPVIFVHEFEEADDCVAVQCPEDAPYLVACDISFTASFENYFCVALEADRTVFLKSGNACTSLGSLIAAGSTLTCSSEPLENEITTEQCVTNRNSLDLVTDRCDCEMAYNIDGCT